MKKVLFSVLALLLIAGTASAANIPRAVDPEGGPETWKTPIFNNSSATVDVGDVVVWDIGSSTGDNDNYISTTTTASTHIVAGVIVDATIVDQATGSIVIRGMGSCDTIGAISAGTLLCTSTTAGAGTACPDDQDAYALATSSVTATGTVDCFLNP